MNNITDKAILSLTIWPHRSCTRGIFHFITLLTALTLLLPPLLFLNVELAFAILPFSLISISLLYLLGEKNFRDGKLKEKLEIFPKKIILQRAEPTGRIRIWSANPFWIHVNYYKNGPIKNYLTLRENGKEVEVGSFLTPKERENLRHLIEDTLHKLTGKNFSS